MGVRRYHIEEVIGRGGFGVVYRATMHGEDGFEKPVAIKLVDSDQGDAFDRLIDEARLLGRMQHHAIPGVDGLVTMTDGRRALVLEHVRGADLYRVAQRTGPLPLGPLCEVAATVASALDAALHAPGPHGPVVLIHRDIKPSNLMLTPSGHVKLLDFGIARGRIDRASKTMSGESLGTTAYMAPEALDARPVPASDVYSLALTLLRLRGVALDPVLGLQPASSYDATARRFLGDADLPRPLQTLLLSMLAPNPTDRPHAIEVAERCRAIARGQPPPDLHTFAAQVFATPPPPKGADELVGSELIEAETTTTHPSGRRRWLVLGGGTAVVAVTGLGALALGALLLGAWLLWG